jgi:inner membrane protein
MGSWLVAAAATDNPRDCRLVTLAGILPDLDGLGVVVDLANMALGRPATSYYAQYHHWWLHGLPAGLVIAAAAASLARRPGRVALSALLVFHLHLLCDLVGSRGPSPTDLWPIYYLGPLSVRPLWVWHGQWRLDGGMNRFIALMVFAGVFWMSIQRGHSVVGVFNQRADATVVAVLRRWHASLSRRLRNRHSSKPG